ncbi:g6138 [Coccomyxa viridis]|uniref:V-type proton ATPase subunit C n=1 Tax=Coccomyxa viridis TaxID=1274662 RepID=A0ABP1FUM4_9CHLO
MYWLVCLPILESEERTWTLLQNKTTYESDYSINFKFAIPELRVGTLDTLMVLSDELVKVNALVESVVNKIRRQLFEMASPGRDDDFQEVSVAGQRPDQYLESFSWDAAKFPPRRPLNETVSAITENVQKLEDDLKVRMSEYNQLKGQVTAAARKQTGSLAVRDLTGLVSEEDAVNTENLLSLFTVVSKHDKAEWLSTYETLSDFVVPRSSKLIYEDNDYALYSVTLFKRVADSFKQAARSKGFQVRDYEFDQEMQSNQSEAAQSLKANADKKRKQLEEWSASAYGEAFSAWIHICAIRLFVESILRYGLPPRFLAALMKPNQKSTARLRKTLGSLFGNSGTSQYFDGDDKGAAGLAGDSEMYPYVSFTISVDG